MAKLRSSAWVRVAAAVCLGWALVLSAGCDVLTKGTMGENPLSVAVTYSIRSTPSGRVKPGGSQTFFVEKFTEDHSIEQGGSELAVADWKWSVTGPAAGTIVPDSPGQAHWTAPQTEGTYMVHTRAGGKTPTSLTATIKVTTKEITVHGSASGAPIVEEGQQKAPTGTPVKVLETGNVYGIKKGGKAPSFTISKPATVVDITDYHYIDGGGPTPGTIGLRGADGKLYGPWPTTGLDGQGGVKNAFWVAKPNAAIPAGTYTVVDSGPGTWSTNSRAKGLGFSIVNVAY